MSTWLGTSSVCPYCWGGQTAATMTVYESTAATSVSSTTVYSNCQCMSVYYAYDENALSLGEVVRTEPEWRKLFLIFFLCALRAILIVSIAPLPRRLFGRKVSWKSAALSAGDATGARIGDIAL